MNTQRPISFALILPIAALLTIFLLSRNTQSSGVTTDLAPSSIPSVDSISRYAQDWKQRGMHFFGRREMEERQLQELKDNHIEWLTFVPYGWQADYDSDQIGRRGIDYTTWTRRDSAFARQITSVKQRGFYVMVKPHIWMGSDARKWRSEIEPAGGAAGWKNWAESYRAFILHYAKMSEQLGVELFCIGTELHQPVKRHPDFWKQLIREIRAVYSGQLTYAANWYQEVDDVPFWRQLDFIGIQAYYPLCKETNPTVETLMKGWKPHFDQIKKYHKHYRKPILFTEIGYKSTPDTAIEPWQWVDKIKDQHKIPALETQAVCYEAFFRTFWKQDWFAGAHFWQWHSGNRRRDNSRSQMDFTPQQKPAVQTLGKWFATLGK